jgi:hypothetical protein
MCAYRHKLQKERKKEHNTCGELEITFSFFKDFGYPMELIAFS